MILVGDSQDEVSAYIGCKIAQYIARNYELSFSIHQTSSAPDISVFLSLVKFLAFEESQTDISTLIVRVEDVSNFSYLNFEQFDDLVVFNSVKSADVLRLIRQKMPIKRLSNFVNIIHPRNFVFVLK